MQIPAAQVFLREQDALEIVCGQLVSVHGQLIQVAQNLGPGDQRRVTPVVDDAIELLALA
ncbi:hypothetical protein D3C80_2184150 [compost metagenome]